MRRETTTHKKPLRRLRRNPEGIHEGENRCESSLQVCSELSEVVEGIVQLLPLLNACFAAETLTSNRWTVNRNLWREWLHLRVNRLGFLFLLRLLNEINETPTGRFKPPTAPTTWTAPGSGEVQGRVLHSTGVGRSSARAGLSTVPSPWGRDRPAARPFPKNKKTK